MDSPKITSSGKEILVSGTFITYDGNATSSITLPEPEQLKFNFIFIKDSSSESKITTEIVNQQELNLILTNFESSIGIGNILPLRLGTFNNKNLYVTFRIYTLDDKAGKTVHFTFYVGD